ncbi:universal stress protein [Fulvivirgaceae bacterium PWU5]|uniref:Universal stress protein n=1 Tax=Dawidia cretensis TaxID=2782350 RepID=A0AAP2E050_9BACT|nr:universal stress protein [Dawidia cretensis]MBT1710320.1 universal stress protein [Dawidia cretensis]
MKTIVVATDYSATANNALQFGASLARAFGAELVLLNVYHPNIHVSNSLAPPDAIDQIVRNNENRLRELALVTAFQYQVQVSGVSKTADTVEALEEYVASRPVDLVVMGMDSSLLEYKLFGNTTTAAIRSLKFPLLVVPNDIRFQGIKRILYACEHSYLSENSQLALLKEITRKFDAKLQILHVETKKEPALAAVGDQILAVDMLLEDVGHTYSVIDNPSVGNGIVQGIKAWNADLLVMVPHKAGFWELFLKGSATREMALRTRVPLLVLPNVN